MDSNESATATTAFTIAATATGSTRCTTIPNNSCAAEHSDSERYQAQGGRTGSMSTIVSNYG